MHCHPNQPIPGSVSKRKLDVGLAYRPSDELEDGNHSYCDWSHILVPGELRINPREDNYSSTWLDLLRDTPERYSAYKTHSFDINTSDAVKETSPKSNKHGVS